MNPELLNCKCDSALQHKKMFPHYRVTCAVGLTYPARLNSVERITYARDKNAIMGTSLVQLDLRTQLDSIVLKE